MTNKAEFAVGDIVKLASGGPEMTVKHVSEENDYICQWFAGKKLEQGKFPQDSLTPMSRTVELPLKSGQR